MLAIQGQLDLEASEGFLLICLVSGLAWMKQLELVGYLHAAFLCGSSGLPQSIGVSGYSDFLLGGWLLPKVSDVTGKGRNF